MTNRTQPIESSIPLRRALVRNRDTVALARWALLSLLVIGVGLRLWLVLINPIDPASSTADDGDYYRRALRLALTGEYRDDFWLIRPPGNVALFAAGLRLGVQAGDLSLGLLAIKLAQVAVGALQVLLGYAVAARLFSSRGAGLLYAAFLALWYPFVEQPSLLFSELLFNTLFLAHFWFLLRFDKSNRWGDLALTGLILGVAALVRSPALYSLAFVALWLVVRWWAKRRGAQAMPNSTSIHRRKSDSQFAVPGSRFALPDSQFPVPGSRFPVPGSAVPGSAVPGSAVPGSAVPGSAVPGSLFSVLCSCIVVAACTLAVVLPWTARNYVMYGTFIPVDTLGQVNLWLDLEEPALRVPKIEELRTMPQGQRATYAQAKAREILARDPGALVRNAWPHFQHVWKAQFVEDYYVGESFYDRPLRQAAPLGLLGDTLWLVFTAAGLMALAGPVREGWHNRLFVLAWLGYTLATVVVFHVEPRYLLPIWMLIALYGSGQVALIWTNDERRATKGQNSSGFRLWPFMQVGILIVFFALLVSYRDYPAIIWRGEARERAMRAGDAAFARGEFAAAEQDYRAALAAQANFVDATVQIALAQLAQGQRAQAAATVAGVARRTGWLVELVAGGGGPEQVANLNYAESTTGLDVQAWAQRWTPPLPARSIHLGDGRDIGYISGFSAAEADNIGTFRWMTGRAHLRLPLPAALEPGATIGLRLAVPEPTVVAVIIGGVTQTVAVKPGMWRVYLLPLPANQTGTSLLEIDLRAPVFYPAQRSQGGDLRQLGVMLSDVYVR
ncbi:MAG: glycosyltransferase family 39 protein [Roseiflexaceae bacterium]|nr:glycosyltransferase family 39 protein [Roseiflexaceae bacterium]